MLITATSFGTNLPRSIARQRMAPYETAKSRNVIIARSSRATSSPPSSPILPLGTVVILSTMIREAVSLVRFDREADQRRFSRIGREGAERDRVGSVETVVLDDNRGAWFAGVGSAAGVRPCLAVPHS